jgi:hypothetical protein
MTREESQFRLRVPTDLRDFLRDSAGHNQRSINGEIVYALRQYQKTASAVTA